MIKPFELRSSLEKCLESYKVGNNNKKFTKVWKNMALIMSCYLVVRWLKSDFNLSRSTQILTIQTLTLF